jgi:ribA/ribD-fused uncharacterized protein
MEYPSDLKKCKTEDFHYFWKNKDNTHPVFSNFYPSTFMMLIHGKEYIFTSGEQAFHACKAYIFDPEGEEFKILTKRISPENAKKIGRMIKNFDESTWNEQKYITMFKVLESKFLQNKDLLDELLSVKEPYFAEASPFDKIWGVGLSYDEIMRRKIKPSQWKGNNLLGMALTELKYKIIKKN